MKLSHLLELLLLAALWGASFLLMRIAVPVLGAVWLIELRLAIAGLTLLFLFKTTKLLPEIRRNLLPLIILSCLNLAIPFILFAIVALYLPAGFASILNATVPLFGTAIAVLWLKEKLTWGAFWGLMLGFTGVIVLVGKTDLARTPSFIMATIAGLSGAFLYAIAANYTQQKLTGVSSMVIATGSQLSGAVVLLPLTPFFLPTAPITVPVILVLLTLALFSTALAYILYFRLLQRVGVTKSLTVTYLIPIFAMFWGRIFLDEPISISMILGCSLILSGTAIALNPPTTS